jgi:hypothetical protein
VDFMPLAMPEAPRNRAENGPVSSITKGLNSQDVPKGYALLASLILGFRLEWLIA